MTVTKAKIVDELGARSLLLPDLISSALAANARIKFALSWLQAAEDAGNHAGLPGLETERALCGLGDDPLYAAPPNIVHRADGIFIPGASRIFTRLLDDMRRMRATVDAGATAANLDQPQIMQFRRREQRFREFAAVVDDLVPLGLISAFANPAREGKDSFHALVMDLHKALNAIASAVAEEDICGARVYHLIDADRPRVTAFMRGVNRTAALKFDHPGLATTATRDGNRLIIQNDIGTTDTHVLIAYVNDLEISVVYSDIHARRVDFFRQRLDEFSWTVANRRSPESEDEIFYLATGVLDAQDEKSLGAALEHLGATLVFLIDWNKARKSLRQIVSKDSALELLDWAAKNEVGHRGYLEVGGDAFIVDLLGSVSKATGSFCPSLKTAVGEDGAVDFLRGVMRISSEALRAGRSAQSVRDLLRMELLARLASISDRILDLALDHAAFLLDLGNLVRTTLFDTQWVAEQHARRGREWESKADRLVARIRDLAGTGNERAWAAIASSADDAADCFEEALFRLRFLPVQISAELRNSLGRLAEHAVTAVKEYVRLLVSTRHIHRGAPREDLQEFFNLLERQHEMEHATDDSEREVFEILMHDNTDAKTLAVATSVAETLENSGDALLRTSRLVADHALGAWLVA
ncbi:MAG TPA: hypothetical protein VN154_06450 [Rhizomicrobium sp.]|nr:hypothetical protein [Rhizomicrobium sp.]